MDTQIISNIAAGKVMSPSEIQKLGQNTAKSESNAFDKMLSAAMDNLGTTNAYLSEAENEKLSWALGESENTHDLTNAMQKANISLQYTVAVRDKLLEAYREIMQIQI